MNASSPSVGSNPAAEALIGDGQHYVIMGRPESGYSMKVRSAMRFKGMPHEWTARCLRNEKLFQANAQVQLIPIVFRPDGTTTQDSTPILEELERVCPSPSIHPDDPALRFLSELVEEYGDEWVNKLMFRARWAEPTDQKHRSGTLARGMLDGHMLRLFAPIVARFIIRRMIPRMGFAGANENNTPLLKESFVTLVEILEEHLSTRAYLFGGRPSFGDFGLWGQLHQCFLDPSNNAILRENGPSVVAWIERMLEPTIEGEFETLERLIPTLRPLFAREIGPRFLAWDAANQEALRNSQGQTELEMGGQLYFQKTFKYPAATFRILKKKYAAASEDLRLRDFLAETGCLQYLEA